ncbi:putative nadh dehydrogenase [Operophtera brumata]|uniref:Putative nadh dehydrogenase n=1 Tax=Operophtera brumata TaxID=104452 RepID=A0A0L7LCX0_OPEBR|nr:putative nadh dehydrogenase [Operophtera brumata]
MGVCVEQLIPLYVCTGIGCAMAVFYTLRLATRNPDVSWSKKANPEPWEEYRTKQYKLNQSAQATVVAWPSDKLGHYTVANF